MIPNLFQNSTLAGFYATRPKFVANNDMFTGSPGSWNDIVFYTTDEKNGFMPNPNRDLFTGDPTEGYIIESQAYEPRTNGFAAYCAALYYKRTGDTAVRDKLKAYVTAQLRMKIPGTNRLAFLFPEAHTAPVPASVNRYWELGWPNRPEGVWRGFQNPGFFMAIWYLGRLLPTYFFIRDTYTPAEKAEFDGYFRGAAYFFMRQADWVVDDKFVKRPTRDMTPNAGSVDVLRGPKPAPNVNGDPLPVYDVLDGGVYKPAHYVTGRMDMINNRSIFMVHGAAIYAWLYNDAALKAKVKWYFKDAITYCTFPTLYSQFPGAPVGQVTVWHEFMRQLATHPQMGYGYALTSEALLHDIAMIPAAVDNDFELLDFTTSGGIAEDKTLGGPKSLKGLIDFHLKLESGQIKVYAKDPAHTVMNGLNAGQNGRQYQGGMLFEGANMRYQIPEWTQIARRNYPGMTPYQRYPANIGSFSTDDGIAGTTPGRHFYAALMEDLPENVFKPSNPTPTPYNVAQGKPVFVTVPAVAPWKEAANIVDGVVSNLSNWTTEGAASAIIDLGQNYSINEVELISLVEDAQGAKTSLCKNFSIERSTDALNFTTMLSSTSNRNVSRKKTLIAPVVVRYFRINVNNPRTTITEFIPKGLPVAS